MAKTCKKGYYYCYTSKKCKKIPVGYHVMGSGRLMKDSEHEEKEGGEETKKNGNGNGDNGDGGAVSEGWSEKYKKSIDCKNPKGFSQRAHCQGRKKVNEAKEKDHEVSMAKTQVKKSIDNLQKVAKVLAKKTDADNLPAWVQAKLTDTEHNTDAAASYMTGKEDLDEGKRDGKSAKDKDYSLRDWFAGGGWVQAGGKYDGKPCAKQKGQKTKPFCRDADDRAAMSEDEREKRAKKKRKEDPNPNRKGKAKMVRESNWREELQEKIGIPTGPKTKFPKDTPESLLQRIVYPEKVIPVKQASIGDNFQRTAVNVGNQFKGPGNAGMMSPKDIERSNKGIGPRIQGTIKLQQAHYEPQGEVVSEKKDACYKKVKARYDVWPSAYASGALVKCRKVGAANWGNKTKKESYDYSNWRDDFKALEIETIDLIKAEPLIGEGAQYQVGDTIPDSATKPKPKPTGSARYKFGVDPKLEGPEKPLKKEGYSNWREELLESDDKVTNINKGKRLDAKQQAFKDMGSTPYDPNEGRRRGKKILDRLLGQPDIQDEYIPEDWQKVNKKDKTDGMSQKAVNAYKRENPGSKLQTAVTEKNPTGKRAERRKNFCSRSNGQRKMHNIDCSKTPDKAICKARKRWRC